MSNIQTKGRKITLTIIGIGATALITADTNMVDFGAILVNDIVEKEVSIFNQADCDVFYDLEVYCIHKKDITHGVAGIDDAADLTQEMETMSKEVETLVPNNVRDSQIDVQSITDILPARSIHRLKVRACLRDQTERHFRIYYIMKPQSSLTGSGRETSFSSDRQKVFLCDVKAIGVHPVVRITDLRCEGFGKTTLWELFSVDKFNETLAAIEGIMNQRGNAIVNPDIEEALDFPIETEVSNIWDTPAVDFNFGAATIGCKSTVYHMNLMNPGVVPVEWIYHFPNDLEVEVETWADPGDYTEEQIYTNLIMDNALFTIEPKVCIYLNYSAVL
jgi:cilia- and flagella-associated protein 65